jgi:hypothetical protein
MGNKALDKSSRLLLRRRPAWPEKTIEFEAAVPWLDVTVALRVIRVGSDMGQSGQTDKLLKVLDDKLWTVIGDDSRRAIRISFPGALQNDLDIKLRHLRCAIPNATDNANSHPRPSRDRRRFRHVQIRDIHMKFKDRLPWGSKAWMSLMVSQTVRNRKISTRESMLLIQATRPVLEIELPEVRSAKCRCLGEFQGEIHRFFTKDCLTCSGPPGG